jgi:hypothetical protein
MRNVIVAIALTLVGCVHQYGRQFSYEDTKKLTPGASTRADAERIFGPPVSVTSSSDGTVVCGWSYTHAGFMGSNVGSKVLLLTFRPDGTYDRASETASGADAKSARPK